MTRFGAPAPDGWPERVGTAIGFVIYCAIVLMLIYALVSRYI